jgi:hypothetical protein
MMAIIFFWKIDWLPTLEVFQLHHGIIFGNKVWWYLDLNVLDL